MNHIRVHSGNGYNPESNSSVSTKTMNLTVSTQTKDNRNDIRHHTVGTHKWQNAHETA